MPDLLYEKRDRFAVFTMNRPERLNALGGTLAADLAAALADFNADPAMRAAILTGAGRAFSAGADLKEMNQRNIDRGDRPAPARAFDPAVALPFSRSPKPFIATINGLCIAGGLERALDCDIRICSTKAWFGLFEVKRGILAGYAIHHLARLVPFSDAMYVLLTGDRVEPDDALRMGLVREVLQPDELLPRAEAIATMIAENAPLSVEGSKFMAQHWRQLMIDESYRTGEWVSRAVLNSEDAREGPRAFSEKRPARWQSR